MPFIYYPVMIIVLLHRKTVLIQTSFSINMSCIEPRTVNIALRTLREYNQYDGKR